MVGDCSWPDELTMTQRRILIVEDERAIREMVCIQSRSRGLSGVCRRATRARRGPRSPIGRPDLVVMDWMLPDISGLELTRQLKRDAADEGDSRHHADGARVRRTTASRGSTAAPTTTSSSRSRRASCWRGFARRCGAHETAEGEVVSAGDVEARLGEPPGQRRRRRGRARPHGVPACSSSSCAIRIASTAARSCSTASGAATSTSRSAPSTCTSAGCARR